MMIARLIPFCDHIVCQNTVVEILPFCRYPFFQIKVWAENDIKWYQTKVHEKNTLWR